MTPSEDDDTSTPVGFAASILPMFTEMDINHMAPKGVPLDDYSYMSVPKNAETVYKSVSGGFMPPGGSGEEPWSPAQVALFQVWMEGGYQP